MQIDFSAAFDMVNHQGILYKYCSVDIGASVNHQGILYKYCSVGIGGSVNHQGILYKYCSVGIGGSVNHQGILYTYCSVGIGGSVNHQGILYKYCSVGIGGSVNHQGILYRLCSVGIGGSVLSILTQILSNRSQHAMLDGCLPIIVPPIVNGGDRGCIVRDLETIIVLVLLAFKFHLPKVTPLTNPAKVKDQGLCYCNSDAWGWHNSHQSGVISITDQLIFQNGKSSEVYRRNNNGPKHCHAHSRYNVNQFTSTTIHHNLL